MKWLLKELILEVLLVDHIRGRPPVQVRCRIQDAWGWCTGMTQRDGMGREVEGGFRIGNTCTTVADSCWCMAKPIQYCKVKKKKKMIFKVMFLFIYHWAKNPQNSVSQQWSTDERCHNSVRFSLFKGSFIVVLYFNLLYFLHSTYEW